MLPKACGIFKFHEDPHGIPVDGIPPRIVPTDVKLHLDRLIAGIISQRGHILYQQIIGTNRLTTEQ
jgi:hypothetical protein